MKTFGRTCLVSCNIYWDQHDPFVFYQKVAYPGFPVGEGGTNIRQGRFSAKTHAKTKELGPVGGPPVSATVSDQRV